MDTYIQRIRKETDERRKITKYPIPKNLVNDLRAVLDTAIVETTWNSICLQVDYPITLEEGVEGEVTQCVTLSKMVPAYWVTYFGCFNLEDKGLDTEDITFYSEHCFYKQAGEKISQLEEVLSKHGYQKLSFKEVENYDLTGLGTLYFPFGESNYIQYPLKEDAHDKALGIEVGAKLIDVGQDLLGYAEHVYIKDEEVQVVGLQEKDHASTVKKIEKIINRIGGVRIADTPLAYRWDFGVGRIRTGSIIQEGRVQLYLSRYLNLAFVKKQCKTTIKNFEGKTLTAIGSMIDTDTALDMYLCEEVFGWPLTLKQVTFLDYVDIHHKLPIMQDIERQDVPIGRIVFGLTEEECSMIDRVEIDS